jgi:hypothetical protein
VLGALNNGIDFLRMDDDRTRDKALELLHLSAGQSVARLQFYRKAYGMAKYDGESNLKEVHSLCRAFLDDKIDLTFAETYFNDPNLFLCDHTGKIIMCLVEVAASCLIQGGLIKVEIEKVVDNGLQVIFHKRRQAEVEVKLIVFSGCSDGNNSQMAHFLEHMLFSGSKLFPSADKINKEIKRLDISRNGRTSQESTIYFFNFKSKRLPDAIKFISDFIQNPVLNENDISKDSS